MSKLSEGHLDPHTHLAFIRFTINHKKLTPSPSVKVNDRGRCRRIDSTGQKVMTETSDRSRLVGKSIGLKIIFGLALQADMGPGGTLTEIQLWSPALSALYPIERYGRFVFPPLGRHGGRTGRGSGRRRQRDHFPPSQVSAVAVKGFFDVQVLFDASPVFDIFNLFGHPEQDGITPVAIAHQIVSGLRAWPPPGRPPGSSTEAPRRYPPPYSAGGPEVAQV